MQAVTQEIYLEDFRKLKKIGKEYFQFIPNAKFDPIKESQNFHKLFHFKLDEELSEVYLSPKNISLYLLDYYKVYAKEDPEKFKSMNNIRETVLRWIYSKSLQEKESAVFYLTKLAKVNRFDDFDLLLILSHLIAERRGEIYDEIIEKKFTECQRFDSNDAFFSYFHSILKGFYAIVRGEWEEALFEFDNLENSSVKKINAYFYKTIALLRMDQVDQAEEAVSNVVQFDTKRMEIAVNSWSKNAFKFFQENSFVQHFFDFEECIKISKYFDTLIEETKYIKKMHNNSSSILQVLIENKWKEFKNEDITQKLKLTGELLDKIKDSNSYLQVSSLKSIKSNLLEITRSIKENVNAKFESIISEKLQVYDERIEYMKNTYKEVEKERKEFAEKETIRLNKVLHEFETQMKLTLDNLENQLEKLEQNASSDSIKSFRNSMLYNTVFSLFVLLTGGFAEYSNSYLSDIASVSGMISIILVGGIKWGAISFILGFFLSGFMLVNSLFDRFSRKNSLIKRISSVNVEKENGVNELKKKSEEKKKLHEKKCESRLKQIQNDLDTVRKNREEEREKFLKDNEEDIKYLTDPLDKILEV